MVDVARDIAADGGIPDPALADDEGPQPAASCIAFFAPQALGERDQCAFVLDDAGALLNRAGSENAGSGYA